MDIDTLRSWFAARVPADWFVGPVDLVVDRDEILVMGELPPPAEPDEVALAACIRTHRERTRALRVAIAEEAELILGRKLAWGARCGARTEVFTSVTVPVMTRLRLPERRVLDTLIEAGVARSRSDALAWCVRLVGRHQGDWIAQLRAAMEGLDEVRRSGPNV